MRIANRHGLPQSVCAFATAQKKGYKPNRYSVTELLKPVREIVLSRRYDDEIEVDVADMVPALIGTAVHGILEAQSDPDAVAELSVETCVSGCVVSGRIDSYRRAERTIDDYKTCSASKLSSEDFEDWRMQGLMYAWLIRRETGEAVRTVRIVAMAKDWSKVKAATSATYPQSAVKVVKFKVEDSDYDFVESWVADRIAAIRAAEAELPECTDEEKWRKPDQWAVYKRKGDKRAAAVLASESEADAYIAEKGLAEAHKELREGECTKCRYYCPCKEFCRKEAK